MFDRDHHFTRWQRFVPLLLIAGFLWTDIGTAEESYEAWLIEDYGFRIVVVGALLAVRPLRALIAELLFTRVRAWQVLAVGLAVPLIDIPLYYRFLAPTLFGMFPEFPPVPYPEPTSAWLHAVDLTFGVALVAVSEELLFRAALPAVLARYLRSPAAVVVVTSVVFGLIHWPNGIANVVAGSITGVLLMLSVYWTRSIVPALLAHYLENVVHFW